jgi:hypothetical protein
MKNVLISLLIALVLVIIYASTTLIIAPFVGGNIMSPPHYLQLPLLLPWTIFETIAPESLQNAVYATPLLSVIRGLLILCNTFIYAIPIYLLLQLRSKRGE